MQNLNAPELNFQDLRDMLKVKMNNLDSVMSRRIEEFEKGLQ